MSNSDYAGRLEDIVRASRDERSVAIGNHKRVLEEITARHAAAARDLLVGREVRRRNRYGQLLAWREVTSVVGGPNGGIVVSLKGSHTAYASSIVDVRDNANPPKPAMRWATVQSKLTSATGTWLLLVDDDGMPMLLPETEAVTVGTKIALPLAPKGV